MHEFNARDTVRIKSGPFTSFTGVVKQVDVDRAVLVVEVEIFGRRTPVEIGFSEVENAPPELPYKPPLTSLN